jgi:hypothetical protein
MCLYKTHLSYELKNQRQGVKYENNPMFKGKSKYISVSSHMGMEQNHNINVANKYLKMLQS